MPARTTHSSWHGYTLADAGYGEHMGKGQAMAAQQANRYTLARTG